MASCQRCNKPQTLASPVVAVDAVLPEGPQAAQVGVNNKSAGADMGAFFLDYLASDMDGAAKIGVVGALNSAIQNIRQDGFLETITGAEGVVEAGVVDGQNVQDLALTAAENMLTANPDLTTLYATGEPALLGAIAAVESQGNQDDVKIFGWDLTAQAIYGIDEGYVAAVVQQDPAGMGAAAFDALATLNAGGAVEYSIAVPITIVTSENVDDFRGMFE